ncbi:Glycosyl transferase family 2 [Saccharicrinis carchari]|uniref:Glycosyl transferase family 2 n=1 Tax=Saccharicrinis carchari TaxID=1168039 RepID=A0A521BSB3_SACCC|nr:glycosyltransferase [Saccharicrinis carchari]SMO50009.1 Glycosyl transferase family 2 [Saccharicrinis carchari]
MIRLSVILPMYNVAPQLERCIRSLQEQDVPHQDYEIICVNDGSPDNCKQIVLDLQKEFANIVLIDQQNQGVSMARNNGMDKARGKYLLFVDPDDYVDENSFARILNHAEENKVEVSFMGYTILNQDGTVRHKVFNEHLSNKVYNGTEAYHLARPDGTPDPDRIWAILFLREFIDGHKLRFKPDIPYLEDGEFLVRIMYFAQKCVFHGSSFLQRTSRPGSATHSNLFNSNRALKGFIIAACNLNSFKVDQKSKGKEVEFLNQSIVKFVTLAFTSTVAIFRFAKPFKAWRLLRVNGFGKLDLKGCNKFYYRLGYLYNISPFLLYVYLCLLTLQPQGKKILAKVMM